MVDVAEVRIWDKLVGAVLWDNSRGYASFEYDPGFLNLGYDLAPLMMPLSQALTNNEIFEFPDLSFRTYSGLPGMLSDSLPDRYGTRLLDRYLADQGREVDSVNPIERLCYTGKRGMGALEYNPPLGPKDDQTKSIEIERLVQIATEVLSERSRLSANMKNLNDDDLKDIIRVGTSAGGARAKAVIAYNKSTGDIRSGQIDDLQGYEYWIIKLDGVTDKRLGDPKGYGRIEYAYYRMAKDCGINMTECVMKEENGRAHFMTKRFDRDGSSKIHMQSLCGIAHFDYNESDSYSYEQAFQVLRRIKLPYTDTEELFRRLCFNVIARNQDDHTKNISFLMNKNGIWRLSPAYDVTYAYNPAAEWTRSHQMSISGKRDDITRVDIMQLAKKMNIRKPKEILDKAIDVVSDWTDYAKKCGVDKGNISSIRNTLELKI